MNREVGEKEGERGKRRGNQGFSNTRNVTHAKYEEHTEKQRRHNVVGKIKLGARGWLSS